MWSIRCAAMRLLRSGACSFCLGGSAISGDCRFFYTSAVNFASRQAASWGVGVSSLGGVLMFAVVAELIGSPYVGGVGAARQDVGLLAAAPDAFPMSTAALVVAGTGEACSTAHAADHFSVSTVVFASSGWIAGVAAGLGEAGSTAHAAARGVAVSPTGSGASDGDEDVVAGPVVL